MSNSFEYLPKELFHIIISYVNPPDLLIIYKLYTILFDQVMTKYSWHVLYH
jgi:hypothetical protein